MKANLTDSQKFEHLLSLLPEKMRHRLNAPHLVSVDGLKRVAFSYLNASREGATFKNFRKIDGNWHAVRKDGSLYSYGLSKPRKEVEDQYIASLPDYQDFVNGEAFFNGVQ